MFLLCKFAPFRVVVNAHFPFQSGTDFPIRTAVSVIDSRIICGFSFENEIPEGNSQEVL